MTDTYVDSTVAPGGAYTYALDARDASGASAQGTPATIQVPGGGGGSWDTFITVMFENAGPKTVTPAAAPNVWKMINAGAFASNYAAIGHPSAPNYLAMTCGRDLQEGSDGWSAYPYLNIIDLLEAAGITWGVYCENLPSNWESHQDVGLYVSHHNPFGYYSDVYTNAKRTPHVKDFSQFVPGAEQWQWITPNKTNDGHTPSGAAGAANVDKFLANQLLPKIAASPHFAAGKKSVLCSVWDECDGTGCAAVSQGKGGVVICAFAGPGAIPKAVSTKAYNHYSLLKTWEHCFGTGGLSTGDASAVAMTDLLVA